MTGRFLMVCLWACLPVARGNGCEALEPAVRVNIQDPGDESNPGTSTGCPADPSPEGCTPSCNDGFVFDDPDMATLFCNPAAGTGWVTTAGELANLDDWAQTHCVPPHHDRVGAGLTSAASCECGRDKIMPGKPCLGNGGHWQRGVGAPPGGHDTCTCQPGSVELEWSGDEWTPITDRPCETAVVQTGCAPISSVPRSSGDDGGEGGTTGYKVVAGCGHGDTSCTLGCYDGLYGYPVDLACAASENEPPEPPEWWQWGAPESEVYRLGPWCAGGGEILDDSETSCAAAGGTDFTTGTGDDTCKCDAGHLVWDGMCDAGTCGWVGSSCAPSPRTTATATRGGTSAAWGIIAGLGGLTVVVAWASHAIKRGSATNQNADSMAFL